jgi:hypothetical protein
VIVIVAPIDTAKSLQRFDLGRNRERPPTRRRPGKVALNCAVDLHDCHVT